MLEDFLFSLECVLPLFFLILLGWGAARIGLVSGDFLEQANRFTFRVLLPVSLFMNAASIRWEDGPDMSLLGFILLATLAGYALIWLATELLCREKSMVGTLVQGSFRGNYVLLGIPIVQAAVGTPGAVGKATLVSALLVPLYNLLSVLVLMLRGNSASVPSPKKLVLGIAKNPLILGALAGLAVSFLPVSIPMLVQKPLDYLGGMATPLGLFSIGGIFRLREAAARMGPALYAAVWKVFLLPATMLALGYWVGFRGEDLIIILVAFGAATAVSSYAMATQMGGDGPLAANILILTTLLSSASLALGIYLLRQLGWI